MTHATHGLSAIQRGKNNKPSFQTQRQNSSAALYPTLRVQINSIPLSRHISPPKICHEHNGNVYPGVNPSKPVGLVLHSPPFYTNVIPFNGVTPDSHEGRGEICIHHDPPTPTRWRTGNPVFSKQYNIFTRFPNSIMFSHGLFPLEQRGTETLLPGESWMSWYLLSHYVPQSRKSESGYRSIMF